MSDKKPTDWERIEADYRAGLLTLREIGEQHGVSHTAVRKRAAAYGWSRDLSAKIEAKREELVSKQLVSKEVSKNKAETEKAIVEANAQMQADVILSHRSSIGRGREIVSKLLEEVELQTDNCELFEQLAGLLARSDEKSADKLNDIYQKVISLPGRTDVVAKLAQALKSLVEIERKAFGLDVDAKKDVKQPMSIDQIDARIKALLSQA